VLLVDANVLVYAVNRRARGHAAAREWLLRALAGQEAVGFAWTVVLAFMRLTTHPAVFARPLTPGQASAVVEPTRRHLPLVRGLLEQVGTAGNLVGDAHLAALALEYGATMVSFDRDFAGFEGVAVVRPG
jgi:toxin-antitoxin system PIN domain toxin